MLHELLANLSNFFHMFGMCVLLWGVLLLIGAMLSFRGPDAYVKGAVLIILGGWISGRVG
jgi:hypothetical protein